MQKKNPEPATDLEIIDPDITVTLSGRDISVHEFSFFQGLRLGPIAAPLIADMAGPDDQELTLEGIADAFGQHRDIVLELLTIATGEAIDDLMALNDRDGQVLLLTFWRVNKDFFVNRLLTRKMGAWQPENRSDSANSSAH